MVAEQCRKDIEKEQRLSKAPVGELEAPEDQAKVVNPKESEKKLGADGKP